MGFGDPAWLVILTPTAVALLSQCLLQSDICPGLLRMSGTIQCIVVFSILRSEPYLPADLCMLDSWVVGTWDHIGVLTFLAGVSDGHTLRRLVSAFHAFEVLYHAYPVYLIKNFIFPPFFFFL